MSDDGDVDVGDVTHEVDEIVDLRLFEEIYMIIGPKSYVGRHKLVDYAGGACTKDTRFEEHRRAASEGQEAKSCRLLNAAIAEHGFGEFLVESLEICSTEDAKAREIHWIKQKGTVHPGGYNLMGGDDNGRYTMHPDSRKKCADALRSFGKTGATHHTATVWKVSAPNHIGYRGYHNGQPHGFFSNNFTLEEKRSMALKWHLYGTLDYDRRLPRQRKHTNEHGEKITTPGVKVRFNTAGDEVYYGYHPSRADVKMKSFTNQAEAEEYAKLVTSFGENIPDEYLAVARPPRPEGVDLRFLLTKKFKGSANIPKGTPMGYEVAISKKMSKTGEKISKYFSAREIGWDESAVRARKYRDEHLLKPLPPM